MKKINLDEPQKVKAIGNGAHVFVPKTLVGQKVYIQRERNLKFVGTAKIEGIPEGKTASIKKEPLEETAKSEVKKLEDPDVEAERHFLECLKNAKIEVRAKLIRAAEQQFGKERVKVLVDAANA